MATTEQFSLRWNNFHSNLASGFHELLQASDMVDVTLSVEGQFLQAHKIVLSICSPLFKQLFKINPCKHPVIILRDVTYGNLKDILEFMYLGEVNVLRDNLSAFLRTAEMLQVKGLTGDDSSDTSSKKDEKMDSICDNDLEQDVQPFNQFIESESSLLSHYPTSQLTTSPPTQTPLASNVKRQSKSLVTAGSKRPKGENSNKLNMTAKSAEKIERSVTPKEANEDDFNAADNLNSKLETASYGSESEETNREVLATQLLDLNNINSGQDAASQDQGKKDAQINKHPYKCEKCSKRFSRRDHLRTHEKNIHGEDAGPFACFICSQLYKNSESLRKHIAKFHYQKVNDYYNRVQPDS